MENEIIEFLSAFERKWWARKIKDRKDFTDYLDTLYPNVPLNNQCSAIMDKKCPYCPICHTPLSDIRKTTCSHDCKVIYTKTCGIEGSNGTRVKKQKETLKQKYGVEHIGQIESGKEKRIKTMIQKYGSKVSPLAREKIVSRTDNLNKKGRETLLKRYGVTNPVFMEGHFEKTRQTMLKKYGVEKYSDTEEYRPKLFNPYLHSQFHEHIKTIVGNNVILNARMPDTKFELDLFIPEKNVAIEFNGLYWHSESNGKDRTYHLNKTIKCNQNNIKLIQIFEDEWKYKSHIVKSRLDHILNTNYCHTVYARKCEIREISNKEKDMFLEDNHIQGKDICKIRYGAYFKDELVAVMTFKPTNMVKGGDGSAIELSRFCVKAGHNIVGIASKLLKHFERNHNQWNEIISYADIRWSEGNLYKTLGFEFVQRTRPNYWYVVNDKRMHRSNFMKHKISNDENKHLTEHEIMLSKGIPRIWDCGMLKFRKTLNKA